MKKKKHTFFSIISIRTRCSNNQSHLIKSLMYYLQTVRELSHCRTNYKKNYRHNHYYHIIIIVMALVRKVTIVAHG